ncbi:hypothetical protein OE88DRAFT_1733387 [Heliocybe sulcata]|uniref:Uncharacterized protein n=1 Tax=Heliocybe sulcata TaxID=5364 RepID=A0A5C3NAI0_9AGAM|nr:hypothetical protein OE88DRAFT_1733387 [Heliocybe sulcata]
MSGVILNRFRHSKGGLVQTIMVKDTGYDMILACAGSQDYGNGNISLWRYKSPTNRRWFISSMKAAQYWIVTTFRAVLFAVYVVQNVVYWTPLFSKWLLVAFPNSRQALWIASILERVAMFLAHQRLASAVSSQPQLPPIVLVGYRRMGWWAHLAWNAGVVLTATGGVLTKYHAHRVEQNGTMRLIQRFAWNRTQGVFGAFVVAVTANNEHIRAAACCLITWVIGSSVGELAGGVANIDMPYARQTVGFGARLFMTVWGWFV